MKVPLVQWLQWIGATLVAAVTMSAFVFGNFETREAAREKKEGLERRLDRMENKMDVLIERVRR